MSEPQPQPNKADQEKRKTIIFMVILSFICALILSILASTLAEPQEVAKELDRSEQMLIATRIISPFGYFQVQNKEGNFVPATFENGKLTTSEKKVNASSKDVLKIYRERIVPFLVNSKGVETTFEKAAINEEKYTIDNKTIGYYKQPWKIIYRIINPFESKETQTVGYVIPVNGMGLWDSMYGYLAIKPDGNSVIGISWYDHKETPGLGGNISGAYWQSLFPGKQIFQPNADGKIDPKSSPIGITVIKGKVSEVLGDSPKSYSSVDGMAGATLTGNAVTDAYKNVLAAYRPFLEKAYEKSGERK